MIEAGVVSCLENLLLCATKTSILVRNNGKKKKKLHCCTLYFTCHFVISMLLWFLFLFFKHANLNSIIKNFYTIFA